MRMSHFSPEFFRSNRQRLQTLFAGTAPIVITAHGLMQRNNDTTYPFRQDSYFWYLTGINEPDVVLVIDKGKEYLIAPVRDGAREAFDGSIDAEQLRLVSGIETVLTEKEGWRQLGVRLKRVKHVATLSPPLPYVPSLGIYTNPARQRLADRIKGYSQSIELLDLRPQLSKMRSVKQPAELKAMQQAIDLTIEAYESLVASGFGNYEYENQVEAYFTSHFRRHEADHAYQPIIASGKNACTLHYIQNSSPLQDKSLLLLDVGAEIEGYSADITRTYPIGKISKRQREIIQAVVDVQKFTKSIIKVGVSVKDCETKIEQYMGEKLRELGLIKTIDHESVRRYYPHATSHFLGLDVHDVGDYEAPLEPGMVITVEPGIYIPEEGIGVRIEDDVLITDTGINVLTERLPVTAP